MSAKKSIPSKIIREIIRPIKQFFGLLFFKLPTIYRETLRYIRFSNVDHTDFRGKFHTFKEAMDSAPKNASKRGQLYKDALLPSVEEVSSQMHTRKVRHTEYPMFFWLNMIAKSYKGTDLSVLDFGGVYGAHYFSFINTIKLLDSNHCLTEKLKWQVVEVPRQVELGKKIAKTLDIKNLNFMTDIMDVKTHNVLISSSAFQYIENLFDLLKGYFLNANGGGRAYYSN